MKPKKTVFGQVILALLTVKAIEVGIGLLTYAFHLIF